MKTLCAVIQVSDPLRQMATTLTPVAAPILNYTDYEAAFPILRYELESKYVLRSPVVSLRRVAFPFMGGLTPQLRIQLEATPGSNHVITTNSILRYDFRLRKNVAMTMTGGRMGTFDEVRTILAEWIRDLEAQKMRRQARERCGVYKEELMMKCWAPERVMRLVEAGVDMEDM